MSNYTVVTNWVGLDSLLDTDPNKVISGAVFETEFTTLQTALNSKQDELTIKDEDDMATDSATAVASQQSIKAYVDNQLKTPGLVAQVATLQTRTQATYTAPNSGDGGELTELNMVMTPKDAGNKVILEWHFNGEVHHDTVWIVTRDDVQLANTTDDDDHRWAGVSSQHDSNNSSTPDNAIIRIIDEDCLATETTYKLLCRSSTGSTHTVYLNRTIGSAGQDSYEAGLSSCVATEVWV